MAIEFFYAGHTQTLDRPSRIFHYYCGRYLGTFFDFFAVLFVFLSFTVMVAGAGAVFEEHYELSRHLGGVVPAVEVCATVWFGLSSLVDVIGKIGPVIALIAVLLGEAGIVCNPEGIAADDELLPSLALTQASSNWFLAALSYVGSCVLWLAAFLASASDHRLFALSRLAAFTGARRGELLNLRWADLDLGSDASMLIRGSAGIIAGQRVEGRTKGGHMRRVSLDAGTVAVLLEHQAAQESDRVVAGGSWVEGGYVFRMQLGAPIYPDTPSNLMRKLTQAHNAAHPSAPLPRMRFHDLRHLHATLLLRAGVPVHVVAGRLGHADSAVTLRVYAHVLSDQASGAAGLFAQAMGEGC